MHTDSTYVIKGISEWIWAWRRRGWKTAEGNDVLNRELWQALEELVTARGKGGIAWHYVRGHSGIPGNERVDRDRGRSRARPADHPVQGPLTGYDVAIFDLPDDTAVPKRRACAPLARPGARPRRTPISAWSTARRCGTPRGPSANGGSRGAPARVQEGDERGRREVILRGWQFKPGTCSSIKLRRDREPFYDAIFWRT